MSSIDKFVINKAFNEIYPDFEDAVQYYSAQALNADVIITRDKADFTMAAENEIMTPEEFLDSFFESLPKP